MKYYLAVEIEDKPFIQWHLWANSIQELAELEEFENPLIVAEDQRPDYINGVCPLKIISGELVERSESEMSEFEAEYLENIIQLDEKNKLSNINAATFVYASKEFPMHEAARLSYLSMALYTVSTGDVKFLATDGTIVTIIESDKANFLNEFYKRIQELTTPNIR